ncbi:MAG: hypothetical protein ACI89X_000930 [Planctomycetota bacterium]|jgi:hypothetical protein
MTLSSGGIVDTGHAVEHLAKHGNVFSMEDVVVAKVGRRVVAARHGDVHASSGDCELGLRPV